MKDFRGAACSWRNSARRLPSELVASADCGFHSSPVLLRGFAWFAKSPQPLVVRRLGWTKLMHAVAFGVLLATSFCLA